MDIDLALEHALNGDAFLFAGAGFSRGASNLLGQPLKIGSELAMHLSGLSDLPEDTPLDDAAEEFVRLQDEDALISLLKQEYTAREVNHDHVQIASVPWRRIYTTNYDNVLEKSYNLASKSLMPIVNADDIRSVNKGKDTDALCVHLNGYIDRLSRETLWSEIKLTDSSYLTASIESSPLASLFRQDLSLARAVFFLGYSLADLDIRRLLYDEPTLRNKSFFA